MTVFAAVDRLDPIEKARRCDLKATWSSARRKISLCGSAAVIAQTAVSAPRTLGHFPDKSC